MRIKVFFKKGCFKGFKFHASRFWILEKCTLNVEMSILFFGAHYLEIVMKLRPLVRIRQ